MITYKTGDIFQSNAQVITNTINCVGVMGKGLALTYKEKFPAMFIDYKARCDRGDVNIGKPYLWEDEKNQILNFPTKRHWKQDSLLSDIEDGLKYLAENYVKMGITSLALPTLGCGLGGLEWNDVKSLINKYLGSIQDLDVYVYVSEVWSSKPEESNKLIKSDTPNQDGWAAQQSLL